MATRVIDDSKLQNIAVAIQSKDNGGQMTVDEMAGRIEAIPTGTDFDMTVTANQVKMIIEVDSFDLSFWTRFGISGGGTVTVDWGDGTVEEFTGNSLLEYAPQRKHNYQEAGQYLITETIENGSLEIGSINEYSTLSEGQLVGYYNSGDTLRAMFNYKLKELSFGDNIVVSKLQDIPYFNLHSEVFFDMRRSSTNKIVIKNGRATIGAYWFESTTAYIIKLAPSIIQIDNYAFSNCRVKIIDFTDFSLNENNELPFIVAGDAAFRGSNSTILLFATQEIAEVAKVTTNLSAYASRIKYVGEV